MTSIATSTVQCTCRPVDLYRKVKLISSPTLSYRFIRLSNIRDSHETTARNERPTSCYIHAQHRRSRMRGASQASVSFMREDDGRAMRSCTAIPGNVNANGADIIFWLERDKVRYNHPHVRRGPSEYLLSGNPRTGISCRIADDVPCTLVSICF
ncbi:hypothetical protein BD414DRAFT_531515 [Trametes punicea]|nr:hypothetical protein BD414DRAFT_531515 [Trametes punicea]